MGSAGAQRPRADPDRALARCVPEAVPADHHADRRRAARACRRGGESWGARVPGQADLAAGAAPSPALDLDESAPDGADRRALHSAAAPPVLDRIGIELNPPRLAPE